MRTAFALAFKRISKSGAVSEMGTGVFYAGGRIIFTISHDVHPTFNPGIGGERN